MSKMWDRAVRYADKHASKNKVGPATVAEWHRWELVQYAFVAGYQAARRDAKRKKPAECEQMSLIVNPPYRQLKQWLKDHHPRGVVVIEPDTDDEELLIQWRCRLSVRGGKGRSSHGFGGTVEKAIMSALRMDEHGQD